MKKLFLQKLLAAAVLMLVPVYFSFGADDKVAEVEIKPEQGYVFSVRAEQAEYRPKDIINLVVTLKNVGNTEARPGSAAFLISSNFQVQLSNGHVAPLTLYGKRWFDPVDMFRRSGGNYLFSIKPQEENSRSFDHLNRFFDMTLPGTYKVFASIEVPKRDGTKGSVVLTSNTIEIVVDENAKPQEAPTEPKTAEK